MLNWNLDNGPDQGEMGLDFSAFPISAKVVSLSLDQPSEQSAKDDKSTSLCDSPSGKKNIRRWGCKCKLPKWKVGVKKVSERIEDGERLAGRVKREWEICLRISDLFVWCLRLVVHVCVGVLGGYRCQAYIHLQQKCQ